MKTGILDRIAKDLENEELDLTGPQDNPVAEGETIAGVIEDEGMRRQYALIRAYRAKGREATARALELIEQKDTDEFKSAFQEAKECAILAEFTDGMFWQDLRDAFGLHDKDIVGLRDDWQVVWYDEPRSTIEIVMISSR